MRWPWSRITELPLRVDYSKPPTLPRDAVSVQRHIPVSEGVLTFGPGNLIVREMPRGKTYAEYYEHVRAEEQHCDVRLLEAFIEELAKEPKKINKALDELFGGFQGQLFFLGTSFLTRDGNECVSFLNRGTRYPAIRYMCPTAHPVNHDVLCCACFFRPGDFGKQALTL